jgi:hypothetical protein
MEMKNAACKSLITLALVLLALTAAYAQKISATVNIPFTFTVDNVRMPAGDYIVSSPSERVVTLQHVGGPEAKATMTNNGPSAKSVGPAKLVFHRYGNAYFLAAAGLPNSDHAREFYASAGEIQLARNGGQDVVELALLARKYKDRVAARS